MHSAQSDFIISVLLKPLQSISNPSQCIPDMTQELVLNDKESSCGLTSASRLILFLFIHLRLIEFRGFDAVLTQLLSCIRYIRIIPLLLALLAISSCTNPPYRGRDVLGAEDFVMDSYRIREGKLSILSMEG